MATIVTRAGKGSPLTNTEVDSNFSNLNNDKQEILTEGAFVDGDKSKLDGIEALADVTDTANVTAAGALMDSEVTNLAAVKAFDPTDYATAAQGALADTALQDGDTASSLTITSADINGGTIDGVTIGGSSAGAGTFTNLTATGTVTLNQSTIDGLTVGQGAGNVATNTAVGKDALNANTTGGSNTAIGQDALGANTTASYNTAVGKSALYSCNTGAANTATGYECLYSNTTGLYNAAYGVSSLLLNTSGNYNTAYGVSSLYSNTTASNNTAVGYQAGYDNTTGSDNTFVGDRSGTNNTSGYLNCFIGDQSGQANTTGHHNTYVGGGGCGYFMTTGNNNTILGSYNGNQGGLDIRTSSNNIVLSDGDGNPRLRIDSSGQASIGAVSSSGGILHVEDSNVVFTSKCTFGVPANAVNIAGLNNVGTTTFQVWGDGDVENTNNSYGSISDQRLKENIVDAGSQWDDVKLLQVKKYSFISDALNAPNQIGVIAQDLEASGMAGLVKDNPLFDENGEATGETQKSVKYSVLYMKAVKALQEAMERIEQLEADVAALKNP